MRLGPRRSVLRRVGLLVGAFLALECAAVRLPVPVVPMAETVSTAAPAGLSPEASAAWEAAQTGSPVTVDAETTPTELVTANPDGTFTFEASAVPVRVRQGDAWVPVNTSLEARTDGTVAPKAVPLGVVFSGGGADKPLASVNTSGGSYEVESPWALPAPVLSGSSAVYQDVMPGVDLVVDATSEGFSENLVVKTREAALNPALAAVRFPTRTIGLSVETTSAGEAVLRDPAGHLVLTTGSALMWDSAQQAIDASSASAAPVSGAVTSSVRSLAVDPSATDTASGETPEDSARAVTDPTDGARTQPMEVAVDGSAMTITPDQGFLSDPNTVYPVVLDPQTTAGTLSGWTALWSNESTTSFWETSHALGVGYDAWVDNKKVRSLYQFDTHTLGGKKILAATFTALEVWSANCTQKAVQLWRTGPISLSSTWSKQPTWSDQVDTESAAKGYSSSCPGGNVSFKALDAVAYTAGQSASTTTLGLRADESDEIAWKQFASPNDTKPTLSVTFVSAPSVPTSVRMSNPSLSCATSSSSPSVIRDTTPTLSAAPKSSDGSQATLRPNFEVYNSSNTKVSSGSPSAWTASGTAGTWTTSALTNGQTYHFHARSQYMYSFDGVTGYMYSGWSGYCYVKVDTSAPPTPDIDSTAYPECAGPDDPDTCVAYGGVGKPGSFTLKANGASDVVTYKYSINGGVTNTKTFSTATASYTVSLTPTLRDVNSISLQTLDAAGNTSASYTYYFKVAPGAGPVHTWSFDEGTGATAADSVGGSTANLTSGSGWTGKARLGSALQGNGTSGYATTSGPAVNTANSFTVSAWVRLNSTAANSTFVAQEGTAADGFQLYYSTGSGWVFNRHSADVTSPTIVRARSSVPVVTGVWTHLTGVYDAQDGTISLYVNGVNDPTQDADFTTPWNATKRLDIGTRLYQGALGEWFNGAVDQVQIWDRVVSPQEIGDMQAMEDANGHAQLALMADWAMSDGSGSTLADSSGYAHTATLASGAALAVDSDGGKGAVLSATGTSSSYASASGPIVDSTGSFTLSSWVNLDATALADTTTSHIEQIAGQAGNSRNSWGLWYSQPSGSPKGMWVFGTTTADSTSGTVVSVPADIQSAQLVDPGGWTLVTGVYDAGAQQLYLYVNGVRQGAEGDSDSGTATGDGGIDVSTPWQATGTFSIGRGRAFTGTGAYGDNLTGQIDDVRVWTGPMSAGDVNQLYVDELPIVL